MAESSGQPPASSPTPSTASFKELLQRGTQAAEQQDYEDAIAAFEALRQPHIPANYRLKAQIGLIRVYAQMDNRTAAAALCRPLTNHPHPQVKGWAQQFLNTLGPSPAASAATSSSERSLPEASVGEQPQSSPSFDRSGFTPLPPSGSKPAVKVQAHSSHLSGAQAAGPASAPAVPHSAVQGSPKLNPTHSAAQADLLRKNELPQGEPATAVSLFHYQQLNKSGHLPLQSAAANVEPLSPTVAASVGVLADSSAPITAETEAMPSLEPLPFKAPAPLPILKLWVAMGATAIAWFWLIQWLIVVAQGMLEALTLRLYRVAPAIRPLNFDSRYGVAIAISLVALLLVSPWVMDWLLRHLYQQKVLSPRQLKTDYPESVRTLRRICQQHGWPLPELRQLPDPAPLCFSYGWWPSNLRVVVSQGLLDRLDDAELATLYAYEMGHLQHWELPLMSGLGTLLFLVYQGYWQTAQWGNRQRVGLLQNLAGLFASFCYGLFWLLRKAGLWLSRLRSQYCDRTALAFTHSPTVYAQCLLKLTQSLAAHTERQGETSPLLESLDLLTPLSHQIALSPGSCLTADNLSALTAWDRQNPYRRWLLWNLPHPLLGERLMLLERSGAGLGLLTETEAKAGVRVGGATEGSSYLPVLLAQGTPLVGLLIGLALAMLLWFLGGIMEAFDGWLLSWLYQDVSVLKGITLLGLGIGLMLTVNRQYPEIRQNNAIANPSLETLLKNPMTLPADSRPVRMEGKLIGRPGLANWLCQDILLQTASGIIRLRVTNALGPLGNLLSTLAHPETWRHRTATVTGWIRRGATLTLEVNRLQLAGKFLAIANPPLWTTLLSLVFCLWGIVILFRGY